MLFYSKDQFKKENGQMRYINIIKVLFLTVKLFQRAHIWYRNLFYSSLFQLNFHNCKTAHTQNVSQSHSWP